MGALSQSEGAPLIPGYLASKAWLRKNSLQPLADSAADMATLKANA